MKQLRNRLLAMLLVLVLCLGMIPAVAQAATVDYEYSGSYVYNWGVRGEDATFLSPMAEDFYTGQYTYSQLSQLSGSTSTSSVPSSALYKKLQTLMSSRHKTVTSYDGTRSLYQYTDCQNSGKDSKKISSFYSGTLIGPSWDSGKTWNREHTWPNSKGSGSAENDIMMLRPTSVSENSSRGNTAYGEGSSYYHPNSESGGKYDLRGDVARIVLYVYVRWGNTSYMWGTSGVMESREVLLDWIEADPVDTWELGRNDSVESITGTRNVFVDYPELAFLMFGQDVPENMTTPSGEAGDAVSYTVTAQSNNTAYGTVSVSGNTITANPAAGYVASGYTVVSGSAQVSRSGNVFTVKPSSDCIMQINFAPREEVILKYSENGMITSTVSPYAGDTVTLPTNTVTPNGDKKFAGWTETPVTDSMTQPVIYAPGSSYTVSANTTLYALYTYSVGGTGEMAYRLVEGTDQLAVNSKVIIAAAEYNYALSTNQKENNRAAAAITKDAASNTATIGSDVAVLTLGAGAKSGTYTFYDGNGYLYAASSKSNHLKTQNSVDDNASFAITVSNGVATLVAQGANSRSTMQYNNNSSSNLLFSCYSSASQKSLCLYVLSGSGTKYYTTTFGCSHEYVNGLCCKCELIGDGEQNYASFADAISETASDYLRLNFDVTEDVVVDCDMIFDLNGKTLTGDVEIYAGASLKLIDSATADYTAENRGKVVGDITGELIRAANTPAEYEHNYKYLTIQEADGSYSAHRVHLTVKTVSLAPCIRESGATASAISYKTVFKCSDLVAEYVSDYGIQITGENTVQKSYGMDVSAGENWGTLRLDSTLSTANTADVNAANATRDVTVSACVTLSDGTRMISAPVTRSLQDLVLYADSAENLTDVQKKALSSMYRAFADVMDDWDITNIKSYVN